MADTDLHFGNHISPVNVRKVFVLSLSLSRYAFIVAAFCFLRPNAWLCSGRLLNKLGFLHWAWQRQMRNEKPITWPALVFRFFQLSLTLPGGLLRALHGCQLHSTKWYVCIIWMHLNLSEPARPQLVSLCPFNSKALTRYVSFTLHNCNYVLDSLSRADVLLESLRDTAVKMHMLKSPVPLWLPDSYISVQTSSVCKGPPVSTAGIFLPPCMHHRKLRSGTEPSETTREKSADRVQLPSYLNSFLLAISRKPLHSFWHMDK